MSVINWLRLPRQPAPELMDEAEPDPIRLGESLGDLRFYNRYLGGTATVLQQVKRLLGEGWPSRIRVLDVGAGGGDMLAALGRWCERRGVGFAGVALDVGRVTSRLAAANLRDGGATGRIDVVCGASSSLPFSDREFDVSICSTFLHHLEPGAAVRALGEMGRVSRLAVVAADLRRGWPGYLGARLLAATLWRRHRYSRHDAPASVRGAYTLEEAEALAGRAGLTGARLEPEPFFRWAMRWERPR